jgi:hypothetical protein
MRLSEWRAEAPARAAVETKVVAVLEPVLAALGAGKDPHGWAAWGEDFTTRWQYLVPTSTGLVIAFVRVNVPGEGPRASVKVVRWSRVQVGELAMETQGGHRLLSFSIEGIILKGADAAADRVAAFALVLLGAIDGRVTDFEKALTAVGGRRRSGARGRAAATSTRSPAKAVPGTPAASKPKASTGKPVAASSAGTDTATSSKAPGSRSRTTRPAG